MGANIALRDSLGKGIFGSLFLSKAAVAPICLFNSVLNFWVGVALRRTVSDCPAREQRPGEGCRSISASLLGQILFITLPASCSSGAGTLSTGCHRNALKHVCDTWSWHYRCTASARPDRVGPYVSCWSCIMFVETREWKILLSRAPLLSRNKFLMYYELSSGSTHEVWCIRFVI